MRIEIEIPDFVPPERGIHILSGTKEKIGYIEPHTRTVWVKTDQCSLCGECCKKIKCEHLVLKNGGWYCGMEPGRPVLCIISEAKGIDGCTSKYRKV